MLCLYSLFCTMLLHWVNHCWFCSLDCWELCQSSLCFCMYMICMGGRPFCAIITETETLRLFYAWLNVLLYFAVYFYARLICICCWLVCFCLSLVLFFVWMLLALLSLLYGCVFHIFNTPACCCRSNLLQYMLNSNIPLNVVVH